MNSGYTSETAKSDVDEDKADAIVFGHLYICKYYLWLAMLGVCCNLLLLQQIQTCQQE
jgi:hypothetical protein